MHVHINSTLPHTLHEIVFPVTEHFETDKKERERGKKSVISKGQKQRFMTKTFESEKERLMRML